MVYATTINCLYDGSSVQLNTCVSIKRIITKMEEHVGESKLWNAANHLRFPRKRIMTLPCGYAYINASVFGCVREK